MSQYYNPKRQQKYCYQPDSNQPFPLSRSKIDLFLNCPRCFYLDRRLGVGRPPGFPFSLNSAVDHLLKQEFDFHRTNGKQHPLLESYGVDARPVEHEKLNEWRDNFKGVRFLHEKTNFIVFGAIDDLWINSKDEYVVVDYKSTSKNEKITELDKDWQDGYKRQMEVYQWLLRKNGYKVSDTGYFVYCNGITDKKAFDAKLEFEVTLIAYNGNDSWVDQVLIDAWECLQQDVIPDCSEDCDYCAYTRSIKDAELLLK